MTNEVPDFAEIADDVRTWFMNTKGIGYNEFMKRIKSDLESAYLAGRKAQVSVDAEIASNSTPRHTECGARIAKAIESQVIE